ncbi:hypothetical protein QTJ16_000656 [Diplocarpon rosae]|uniref:C2H2-type domain-containing protein n=1 Tax=Diplocarpon rosae TaxID=946125 RepID=A0AAD9WHJ5_9HELO|nr:hypothetical protein QTJ16_000656 [Diplocarpon rosae]
MDVMELVENEPNARPFQCDWQTCCKSSSLARHRRIHTGKRPYKCAHEGCLKRFVPQREQLESSLTSCSFCRKTTMVKHQRRSHQRGIHSSELDDGDTSDSDSGESPSTPQHPGSMQWPQSLLVPQHAVHGHNMHRANSFADFGGHHSIEAYPMHQQFASHRHSLSGGAQHHYPGPMQEHPHPHPHQHIMHRAPSLPAHASYYVPEQNNPGVATLNTNPAPIQTYQIPRQLERLEVLQSSPSSYSTASRASPVSQESFYTHHPVPQAATYALQNSSPVEQQPMIHYQHSMPQHLHHNGLPPAPINQPQAQEQYHHPAQPQEGQWYDNTSAYQPSIEVVSHIPAYPQVHVFQDPWKVENFDDPSLQLPSARIENL